MKKTSLILFFAFILLFVHTSVYSQNNALVLDGAYIILDGGTRTTPIYVVVDQTNPLGIVRLSGGHINSEGQYNLVKWNCGTSTGNYVYPFGVGGNAADYIPFTFNKTTAGSSDIEVSTWGTNQQNMPHPDTSNLPAVNYMDCQHMNATGDSVTAVIDRFWDIKANSAVTADLTFTYLGTENTTTNPTGNFKAEHWNGTNWDVPVGPGNAGVTIGTGTVGAVTSQTTFSPWALVKDVSPILVNGNTTICSGNSTTLTASGGNNYNWLPSGQTTSSIVVTPSVNTTYTLTGTNANGCLADTNISVSVNSFSTVIINNDSVICFGSNATLIANGGSSYSWNTGATTTSIIVNPTATVSYTVIASNANGCTAVSVATTTVNPLPTPIITGNTSLCTGDATTLIVNGGTAYSWNTGSTSNSIYVNPTSATTYSLIAVNSNGCSATASVVVTINSPPVAVANSASICSGDNAILNASGGGNYLWSTGATSNSVSVSAAGNYSVVVSIGSCADTAYATLTVNPKPTASAGVDVSIALGQSTALSASGGGNYSWTPSTDLSCNACPNPVATSSVTTDYCVYVTNANGCSDSACVRVYVEIICGNVFIPNAFSPNGDGENDILYVRGNCIKEMHIVIYNRWGEKVFESTDITKGWDGNNIKGFIGGKEGSAVYVYHMRATLITGEKIERKGNISLIW
ncbi:MAG: gliding motility-associated C-terminal domain-containing protein [Bacteroidetes bacterium]|nr:gliding motility-associated C-terminal domain-containing protein [Bacteroidota bacterium]